MTGSTPTVYVMGGYFAAGGARMAYEIGLVAHERLGLPCKIVVTRDEKPENSFLRYPIFFPSIDYRTFASEVRHEDIFVCNPSFSDGTLGLSLACRKIMYVQGFCTFRILDRWFDIHVAVGSFVQNFLRNVYALEVGVIPPFVEPLAPPASSWWSRPAQSVWIYLKGSPDVKARLLARLRAEVGAIDGAVASGIDWDGSILDHGRHSQPSLHGLLGARRHFVTLSIGEGFGLVPLEAMSAGTTVLGFDGFGGRDYMSQGHNCAVRSYPDIAGVAADLVESIRRPEWAARMAEAGPAAALGYSRERFHAAWEPVLAKALTL